jgi:two-component system, chemotaxis family, chemotaxis protein CheY
MPYDLSKLELTIIDPNSFSRQILRSLLNAVGVPSSAIREMSDAETALSALEHFTPDIILSEISLPGMDGIAFIEAVRHLEDDSKCYVPIIVCTAHTDQQRVLACRDAGAHEVMNKPMSVKALYQRIVSVIEHPRSFVLAPVYAGPDRRRRESGGKAQTRRSGDDA